MQTSQLAKEKFLIAIKAVSLQNAYGQFKELV
jgi:hypothetical protein